MTCNGKNKLLAQACHIHEKGVRKAKAKNKPKLVGGKKKLKTSKKFFLKKTLKQEVHGGCSSAVREI